MYTKEQLMPKRYPQEKPAHGNPKNYWAYNGFDYENYRYSPIRSHNNEWIGLSKHEKITWFIDIPGAPDEVKPQAYPEYRPSEAGWYITHHFEINGNNRDEWTLTNYNGSWFCKYFTNGDIALVGDIDYFIPARLDEPVSKTDELESEDEVSDEKIQKVKKWLDLQGYDIVKRQPEIAPCPFCGGECGAFWDKAHIPPAGVVECERCGYRSQFTETIHEAKRLHNALAGRA